MSSGASPLRPQLPKRRFYNGDNGRCGSKTDDLPSIIKAAQSEAQPTIVSLKTNEVNNNSNYDKGENNNGDPNDGKGEEPSKRSFIGSFAKGAFSCARIGFEGTKFVLGLPFSAVSVAVSVAGKVVQSVSQKYAAPQGDPTPSTTLEGQDKEKVELLSTHQDLVGEVSDSYENVPCTPNKNFNARDNDSLKPWLCFIIKLVLKCIFRVLLFLLVSYVSSIFVEISGVLCFTETILNKYISICSKFPFLRWVPTFVHTYVDVEGIILSYFFKPIEEYIDKKFA